MRPRAPERLAALIRAGGPMSVADYMAWRLADPIEGYYLTAEPFGAAGDFITAPEISQMFGEMIGLWLAQGWIGAGRPDPFVLCEMGPGRGTLMSDALRAAGRAAPGFLAAARLWLVEISERLRAIQAERLAAYGPRFAGRLEEIPADAPLFLVANELFDALPIRQAQRAGGLWRERLIGLDEAGGLRWGLGGAPPFACPPEAEDSAVYEVCPAGEAVAMEIGARLKAQGGAALIIDYGHAGPVFGDTLQALRKHAPVDALDCGAPADITAHVDFSALARAAGVRAGFATQGDFLERVGLSARAEALARLNPGRAEEIRAAARRLAGPEEMGRLFKVLMLAP